MDKLTPKSAYPVRPKASTLPYSQASGPQPPTRKHKGLMALLRRLSPRLKRSPSPDRNWVKVEPRQGDRTSVASDLSFDTALQVRRQDMMAYDLYHNTPQDVTSKNDGSKGSRGGLSGLLTSLRGTKQSQKHEKEKNNGVQSPVDKRSEKELEAERQHIHRNSGLEGNNGQQNGAPTHTYTPRKTQGPPPSIPATVVPALCLYATEHVDSRPKPDMTTVTVPLHTSTRPTATAQRPHTLNLPNRGQSRTGWTATTGPPPQQQPLPLPPALSHMTQPTQTTSVDSIGSCSLDVNATGTTSPATMEAVDGSRRSLRSVSLENNLSGATTPGGSIGTTTTTPLRPILKPQPYTDPGSLKDSEGSPDGYKTPSYLGISCAANGYSRLNRYDSTLRDGYRSRDASPARLAFSRSRDSSPMRPEWKLFDPRAKASPQATTAKIRELKEELARFKAEFPPQPERGRQGSSKRPGRKPPQSRSISVDRGYLKKSGSNEKMNGHHEETTPGGQRVRMVEINMTDSSSVKSSNYQYSFEQSVVRGGVCESSESVHCSSRTNGDTPDKSFIQSRIERLYGPSALGAGFRSRRSLLELEKEQRDRESSNFRSPLIDNNYQPEEKAPEGFPSVFRHLRPEFRTQLQVKRNTRLRPDIPLDEPLDMNSPKTPGRVIPITLTDTIEKPPVLLPKPQNLFNNKTKKENGVRETNGQPVVVKKVVNGNGNIKEMEIPVVIDSYVNGGVEEKENSVCVPNESVPRTSSNNCSSSSNNKVNGVAEPAQVNVNGDIKSSSKGEKDGHYFLKVVDEVVAGINADVVVIEADFEANKSEMSEEVKGKVLSAIGKARLLVSQKIQQFQGLCHKNIAGSEGEDFPTTCEDLAGFWDMVYIQVEDIRQLVSEVKALKANKWIEIPVKDSVDGSSRNVSTGRAQRKPAPKPIRASKSTKTSSEKSEEGKARDEARKKMMEERRKAMKEAMRAKKAEAEAKKGDLDSVEIFVPDNK